MPALVNRGTTLKSVADCLPDPWIAISKPSVRRALSAQPTEEAQP
jgi:hypothetical protein